jgi:hypothetical protein
MLNMGREPEAAELDVQCRGKAPFVISAPQ